MDNNTFQKACDLKAEMQGITHEIETLRNIIGTEEGVSVTITLGSFCSPKADFHLNEFDLLEPYLKSYMQALEKNLTELEERFEDL